MAGDRVKTEWAGMRTSDSKVFAAGDGAFGGSTIVMAMQHGQRVAYYVKAFLNGRHDPMPYRTPFRTRRVDVAQDLSWEKISLQEPDFFGIGKKPIEFPEIEATYNKDTARDEAARCYRCDAETGSADYSVSHREDLFSMARTNPNDGHKLKAMLDKRLRQRPDPFPQGRGATLDDIVFLPANLSRLVIDPYREACKVSTDLGGQIDLTIPFLVSGFDSTSAEIKSDLAAGLVKAGCGYIGRERITEDVTWLQLIGTNDVPDQHAAAWIFVQDKGFEPVNLKKPKHPCLRGLTVSNDSSIEDTVGYALESNFDLLLLCANGDPLSVWPELSGPPDLRLIRDVIKVLRAFNKEEMIDLVWYGGARSGTDAAKLIAMGCKAVVYGMPVALALGGTIKGSDVVFASDYTSEDRSDGVVNIMKAHVGEASMMARCTGKTQLHNLEPEDLRSVTINTASDSGIPMPGARSTTD
jgi:hypothetical protein